MSRNPKQISKYRKNSKKNNFLNAIPGLSIFPWQNYWISIPSPSVGIDRLFMQFRESISVIKKKSRVGRCSDRATANNVFEIVSNTATFLHSSITFSRWTSLILLIQKWDRFQISNIFKTTFQKITVLFHFKCLFKHSGAPKYNKKDNNVRKLLKLSKTNSYWNFRVCSWNV